MSTSNGKGKVHIWAEWSIVPGLLVSIALKTCMPVIIINDNYYHFL